MNSPDVVELYVCIALVGGVVGILLAALGACMKGG